MGFDAWMRSTILGNKLGPGASNTTIEQIALREVRHSELMQRFSEPERTPTP